MHAQAAQAVPSDAVDNAYIAFLDIKNAPEACIFVSAIIHYLKEVPEYQRLSILRKQVCVTKSGYTGDADVSRDGKTQQAIGSSRNSVKQPTMQTQLQPGISTT